MSVFVEIHKSSNGTYYICKQENLENGDIRTGVEFSQIMKFDTVLLYLSKQRYQLFNSFKKPWEENQ